MIQNNADIPMTPLIEFELVGSTLLAKREQYTPSGSHKYRAAQPIVESYRRTRQVSEISKLLVPSSGNFARAMAECTSDLHIPLLVVTDVLSPSALLTPLKSYPHVQLVIVDDPDPTGSHVRARMRLVAKMIDEDPRAVLVDQYRNPLIPLAYESTLVPELVTQCRGEISAVFVPVGTGGLLCGFAQYRRRHRVRWRLFAVDALGSALFRPPCGSKRHLSGYGNGQPTELVACGSTDIDAVLYASDTEALAMCHRLRGEGIFVGPSSGAVAAACEKLIVHRPELLPDAGFPVLIFPDSGENYIDTAFDGEWLASNGFGDVAWARRSDVYRTTRV